MTVLGTNVLRWATSAIFLQIVHALFALLPPPSFVMKDGTLNRKAKTITSLQHKNGYENHKARSLAMRFVKQKTLVAR